MGDEWGDEPPVAVLADDEDETDSTGIDFGADPVADSELGDLLA